MPTPIRGELRFEPYEPNAFVKCVEQLSGRRPGSPELPQARYLANYLASLGAAATVTETRYIDRHYIEEFSFYYSRCFAEYPNHCARLHFFRRAVSREELERFLAVAGDGHAREVSQELSREYLGYVVIRPIRAAPIGRTVLRSLENDPAREFHTLMDYDVHIAGLKLVVHGLAFQQQDVGVSACATTAIWTALQRVAKNEGSRAPTPTQITEAAIKFSLPGRAYPQKGLSFEQMCEAIRSSGFAPDVFNVASNPGSLPFELHATLGSGIPCVALVYSPSGGHAVTAVGYRLTAGGTAPVYSEPRMPLTFECPEAAIGNLYIHDDRLGPYARADLVLQTPSWAPPEVAQRCPYTLKVNHLNQVVEELGLFALVVPLYPKIRMSPLEVYGNAAFFASFLQQALVLPTGQHISLAGSFKRSGDYTSQLLNRRLPPNKVLSFLEKACLSRYIGITSFQVAGHPLFEALWDTTDTCASGCMDKALLGVVCYEPALADGLKDLVENQYESILLSP